MSYVRAALDFFDVAILHGDLFLLLFGAIAGYGIAFLVLRAAHAGESAYLRRRDRRRGARHLLAVVRPCAACRQPVLHAHGAADRHAGARRAGGGSLRSMPTAGCCSAKPILSRVMAALAARDRRARSPAPSCW